MLVAACSNDADLAPDLRASSATGAATVDQGMGPAEDGGAVPQGPDHCAAATKLAVGATVHGTTCGGEHVGESPCQEPNHPDAFFYVDAPEGVALRLTPSPGFSVLAFPSCTSGGPNECSFASALTPNASSARLFAVERVDATCGEFTLDVSLASAPPPPPAPPPAAGGRCASATKVAVGGSVHGTTCGGAHVGQSMCQMPNHPDAFFYVDAPPGAAFDLVPTEGVSILAFDACDSDAASVCTFNGAPLDARGARRLFAVEHVDQDCGEYTVSVQPK